MMRIGIGVNLEPHVPVARTVEVCQEAERLGFDRVWIADQGLDCRDVFVSLAAVAQKTARVQLGTGITHPFTRHPAVTAAAIASVDELSGGRAFLGLGAGGIDTLLPMGLERRKPLAAVRETIQIVRALNRGEAVDFAGEVFQLAGARLEHRRPDMEIWVAGRGQKMLALAGSLADGVLLDYIHRDLLADHVRHVRAAAGRRVAICYATMIVTTEAALELVRPGMFWRLADAPPELRERLGLSEAQVEAMRRVVATEGFEAVGRLIKDDWVRPFVIMGSPAECAAELARLVDELQLDEFQLPILDAEHAPDLLAALRPVLAAVNGEPQ